MAGQKLSYNYFHDIRQTLTWPFQNIPIKIYSCKMHWPIVLNNERKCLRHCHQHQVSVMSKEMHNSSYTVSVSDEQIIPTMLEQSSGFFFLISNSSWLHLKTQRSLQLIPRECYWNTPSPQVKEKRFLKKKYHLIREMCLRQTAARPFLFEWLMWLNFN